MNFIRISIWLIIHLTLTSFAAAESPWKLSKAEVIIHGTSNLHNWEMQVKEITSRQTIIFSNDQLVLDNVDLTVPVSRIESGNSVMDSKAQNALKAGTFSAMRFIAGGVSLPVSDNSFRGSIKGKLLIAGVTKDVEIPVSGMINSDKNLVLKGDYVIDMTQYDVKPPTAVFGTLKTGREVRVSFTFELSQL